MAMVWPAPPSAGRLYALCKSPAPYPSGVTEAASRPLTALVSVRRSAKQAASPFFGVAQDGSRAIFFFAAEVADAEATDAAACAGICTPRTVIAAALSSVRQAAALRRKAERVLGEVRKTWPLSLPCKGRPVHGSRSTVNARSR